MTRFANAAGVVAALTLSWIASPALAQAAESDAPVAAPPPGLESPELSGAPGSAPSGGAEQAAREEAARRFEAAGSLYAQGDVELAAIELERAYELVPDQRVLYNLAQLRLQLRQYARARRALERYLEQAGADLPPERRERVEADLEMLRQRTATLHATVNVEGAEIVVDDAVVGRAPLAAPLLLDAGEHRIAARKSGYHTRRARISLAGAETKTLELSLELASTHPPSPAVSPGSAPPAEQNGSIESSHEHTWTWIAWSTAGVLGASAAVTGAFGIAASNELESLKNDPDVTRSELDSTGRRADTLFLASDILAGATVVAAGAALYLTLSGGTRSKQAAPSGGGVSFRVSPAHIGVVAPLW